MAKKKEMTLDDYLRVMFAFKEAISDMRPENKPKTNVVSYARQYLRNVAPHISREDLCRMFNMSFSDLCKEAGIDVGEIK